MARKHGTPAKPYVVILHVNRSYWLARNNTGCLDVFQQVEDNILDAGNITVPTIDVNEIVPKDGRLCKIGNLTFRFTDEQQNS